MHSLVPALACAAATLALGTGCTAEVSVGTAAPTRPTVHTTTATLPPAPLTAPTTAAPVRIPRHMPGEVARTTFRTVGVPAPGQTTQVDEPVKGRAYLIQGACEGTDGAEIAYRLVDSRSSSSARPLADRTVIAASLPCDGAVHQDEVGTLAFPVTVQFDEGLSSVRTAYTVVVPR